MRLGAIPAAIRASFVLSINDRPKIRGIFAQCRMVEVAPGEIVTAINKLSAKESFDLNYP